MATKKGCATSASTGQKATSKRLSSAKHICPICEDVIVDQSSSNKGHDSVFCDGLCNTWLHRGCAGLSKLAFEQVVASSDSFYCPHCSLLQQKKEIASLKATVERLSSDLLSISSTLVELSGKVNTPSVSPQGDSNVCQTPAVNTDQASVVRSSRNEPSVGGAHSSSPGLRLSASKYNIVVHGIPERPKGTPRHKRLNEDFCEVNGILQNLDSNAQVKPCVRDCRRIGKYNESKSRSRPVLVTLNSTVEVANVLARSRSLTPPVTIKADLTPAERKVESVLLRERRKLIEAGHERRAIKIRNSSLFLSGRLHGSVVNHSYQLHPLLSDYIPEPTQRSNTPTNSPDAQDTACVPINSSNTKNESSPSN